MKTTEAALKWLVARTGGAGTAAVVVAVGLEAHVGTAAEGAQGEIARSMGRIARALKRTTSPADDARDDFGGEATPASESDAGRERTGGARSVHRCFSHGGGRRRQRKGGGA